MKKFTWIIFVFLAIAIGLYPLAYGFLDMSRGLLGTKPAGLLVDNLWRLFFYLHISFGAVAMLSGWSQFAARFRNRHLKWHRTLGKVYLAGVYTAGTAGLYIAFFATGGIVSVMGFTGLALSWLYTTTQAYRSIRQGKTDQHQRWMIRSYALTFAAVTLRIWLPLLDFGFAMEFIDAYRIIAWLCWVPNVFVAELLIRNLRKGRGSSGLAGDQSFSKNGYR